MKRSLGELLHRLTAAILQLADDHPGKTTGASCGFVLGLIIVLLGFWRTLVICLFVAVGLYLGKNYDEQNNFGRVIQNLFGERK